MSVPARRRTSVLCTFVAACLALAACSNSDDDTPAASGSAAPAPTDVGTPATTAPVVTDAPTSDPAVTEAPTTEPTGTDPTSTEPAAGPDLGEFQPITGVPGVTDDEIQFAMLGTGPSNPLGTCLKDCFLGGVQAYFDWRNSIGGVHGRQLTISRDVDDEMGSGQVKMLELASADDVFGVFFNPLIFQGLPDAAAAGLPVYTVVQGGPEAAGLDNVYTPGLFCADCMRKVTIHQAQLIGATKVATLALGQSQASKD